MSLHRAIVTDVSDPTGLGRLRVEVPSVGAEPLWAPVVVPFGADLPEPPEVGAGVWVAFEADDFSSPVVLGLVAGAA